MMKLKVKLFAYNMIDKLEDAINEFMSDENIYISKISFSSDREYFSVLILYKQGG